MSADVAGVGGSEFRLLYWQMIPGHPAPPHPYLPFPSPPSFSFFFSIFLPFSPPYPLPFLPNLLPFSLP